MNEFIPSQFIKCTECKKVIFSKYEGEFSMCDCQKIGRGKGIAVDETLYYYRWLGRTLKRVTPKEEFVACMNYWLDVREMEASHV